MNVDIIALIIKYNVEYRTGLFVKIIFLLNNLTHMYVHKDKCQKRFNYTYWYHTLSETYGISEN